MCLCYTLFAYAFFNLNFSGLFTAEAANYYYGHHHHQPQQNYSWFFENLYLFTLSRSIEASTTPNQMRWKRNLNEMNFSPCTFFVRRLHPFDNNFINYYFDGCFQLCLKIAYAILSHIPPSFSFVEIWLLDLNWIYSAFSDETCVCLCSCLSPRLMWMAPKS